MIDHVHALPKDYRLKEYIIIEALGFGGFGITYLARDTNLNKLVAIKEYLPSDLAVRMDGSTVSAKSDYDKSSFNWGLERFLDEAQTVAQFNHPNIVKIYRFFRKNGTGYIVMEYIEGRTLSAILKQFGTIPEVQIRNWLWPIIDGLKEVHAASFLHRDIKPQNIMIRNDGSSCLLDFGAARLALGGKTRSITTIMTPGFAPLEQYASSGHQGPWSDIYALGAVMYLCITGNKPVDALERSFEDSLASADSCVDNTYSESFINGVTAALALRDKDRPQHLNAWLEILDGRDGEATRVPASSRKVPEPESSTIRSDPALRSERQEPKVRSQKWLYALIPLLLAAIAVGYWIGKKEPDPPRLIQRPMMESPPNAESEPAGQEQQGGVMERSAKPTAEPIDEVQNETKKVVDSGILVTGSPSGASIYIDGELAGNLPSKIKLKAGQTVTVLVSAAGYLSAERKARVSADEYLVLDWNLDKMIPKYALTIQPEPAKAKIKILNIKPRYQPGIMLEPGRYEVEVTANNYVSERRAVDIIDRDITQRISLEPASYPLTLLTTPSNATVRLVNANTDYWPGVMLEPANYEVEVSAQHHEPKRLNIDLLNGAVEKEVQLRQTEFQLWIDPVPPGDAQIRIKGVNGSYSPGMYLLAGSYEVTVSREGYEPWSGKVELGRTTGRVNVSLVEIKDPLEGRWICRGKYKMLIWGIPLKAPYQAGFLFKHTTGTNYTFKFERMNDPEGTNSGLITGNGTATLSEGTQTVSLEYSDPITFTIGGDTKQRNAEQKERYTLSENQMEQTFYDVKDYFFAKIRSQTGLCTREK